MLKLNYTYLEIQTGHTKWPTMDKYIFYFINQPEEVQNIAKPVVQ